MRREGGVLRAYLHVFAAATAASVVAIATVTPVLAVTRVPAPPPRPTPRPPAISTATVDHPPADSATAFDNGPRNSNQIALTFDADMTPGMLQQLRAGQVRTWFNQDVRDVLDSQHVPATIFLTGLWAATYPEVARSLANDPLFEIGNHSWDHAAFRTPCYGLAGAGDRGLEIRQAQDTIAQITGIKPSLFRFPGDCYSRADAAEAAQLGLTTISGDVRAGDGFNASAAVIANNVLRGLQPGSIVVMHIHGGPNAPMTGPALRIILDAARQRGFGFATVSELLGRPAGAQAQASPPPPTPAEILSVLRGAPIRPPEVMPLNAQLRPSRFLRARPNRATMDLDEPLVT